MNLKEERLALAIFQIPVRAQLVPWLWSFVKENVLSTRTYGGGDCPPCDDQKTEKQEMTCLSPRYTLITYVLQLGHAHISFWYFLIIPTHYVLISRLIHWWDQSPWTVEIFIDIFVSTSSLVDNKHLQLISIHTLQLQNQWLSPPLLCSRLWSECGCLSLCLRSWSPCFSSLSC